MTVATGTELEQGGGCLLDSEAERIQIADLARAGLGPTAIGQRLGRAASTISRELRRNLHPSGQYRPFQAHAAAAARRRRTRTLKLVANDDLRGSVLDRLTQRWSPQQISRALRRAHPDDPDRRVATETIYKDIYLTGGAGLRPPAVSPLRTGRDHRRGQTRIVRAGRRCTSQLMLSVQAQAGHSEGDLIVGPHHRSAIGTLVERQTRYVKLLHLPQFNVTAVHQGLVRLLRDLPAGLRRSLTCILRSLKTTVSCFRLNFPKDPSSTPQ